MRPPSATTINALACPLSAWTGRDGHCHWCDRRIPDNRTAWCGPVCVRAYNKQHIWGRARAAARRRAKYHCERPGCAAARRDIEINHIVPRDNAGYGPGCHHHLDPDPVTGTGGLEALCRTHHQKVTAEQRTARKARQAATKT